VGWYGDRTLEARDTFDFCISCPGFLVKSLGKMRWAIPEGYIPAATYGPGPAMPYELVVPPRRTRHQRFNDLTDPEPIPRDSE
jgi:hypothetical protein